MKLKILSLLFFGCIHTIAQEQGIPPKTTKQFLIKRSENKITIDGNLDEQVWGKADKATNFWQKQPRNDVKAVLKTEVRATYDDDFIYFGAICYDSGTHVVPTLKRDQFFSGDGFAVVLDPLNQATSGFLFGTNPYGVQTDVLLAGGTGRENYNGDWDNRWFVEVQRYQDKWIVEMAIPFKTLRYDASIPTWGINFCRNDKKNNRLNSWTQIPIQLWMIDLGYTGRMEWDQPPKKTNLLKRTTSVGLRNSSAFAKAFLHYTFYLYPKFSQI